jgi:alanine racemase
MSTNPGSALDAPRARAWVEVRADALVRNYERIRSAVGPEAGILPMVKAEAYGLGALDVVRRLDPLRPWGWGVATISEGVALREAGVERPILVCCPLAPEGMADAVRHDLQLSISSLESVRSVSEAARAVRRTAEIHADVDTGMGRSGFDWRTADDWVPVLAAGVEGVRWVGLHTHLHSADEDVTTVDEQLKRLEAVLTRAPAGLLVHALNSAGVFRRPKQAWGLVRPGIFLYGGGIGTGQPEPEPVVSVRARVVHVREAPAGATVGYGATYTASAPERWATLGIGYGDGLPRALGNVGHAIVAGVRVPIIGRISMDVTVVDITGVSAVEAGSVATLLGQDQSERITLDEIAGRVGTIGYEILTGLGSRLPRVWSDATS